MNDEATVEIEGDSSDDDVDELRNEQDIKKLSRSFMARGELIGIRKSILKVSQPRLCEKLINPSTGDKIMRNTLSGWEIGLRPVPLWAARRLRNLADAAKRYDARKKAQ